ncbi:MAG: glycosyltransferase family 2 protein [Lachnospiraceae bacterium]|jgi:glycosyltransferase involved in cell wall biosynthesis|nr:glycosyltransferase family 2 protein [Lachnospiraceae bacterium]
MNELVSIIVPAYQEESRIERCLQSILASTYTNLELIIVNDGSTDNTEKVIQDFKRKNEPQTALFKLVTVPRGGAARARNYGLRLARGDYIGFVDADDMIHPEMIEKLADSLGRGNDLSICRLIFCDEAGVPKPHQHAPGKDRKKCPNQALEMIMWEQIQMSLCAALFRREVIIGQGGKPEIFCPEDVVAFEDFAFICEYAGRCRGFVERLDFDGYFYCKHEGSSSTRIYTAREICYALQPILAIGEKFCAPGFSSHKLLYTFLFIDYWYKEALRSSRHDFSPDSENWRICMEELERYEDVFMNSRKVSLYRKTAMWIIRRHPGLGWIVAKTWGRLIIGTP